MAGKLLVGQAGGATTVINATLVGIVDEAARLGRLDAIWGMRRGAEGALAEDFVDLGATSGDLLSALARTPGAALASSRRHLSDADVEHLLAMLERLDIRYFLYIGGNDSADTVHRLAQAAMAKGQDLRAVAVPKTIDNDLPVTDHSPGYGSIARYVAIATMDSGKDTESMPTMYPVKFVEVMGRDAGWVAAASVLGKRERIEPPHLVYVPEHRLKREDLLTQVEKTHRELGHVVAVVAETIRDEHGLPFADPEISGEQDSFGHALLRGTVDSMCRLVQTELGLRARFDKPGGLQRMSMGCVSSVDMREAEEVGRFAVRMALEGQTDRMVTIVREDSTVYASHMSSAPLEDIANRQRLLPPDFFDPQANMPTEEFRRYASPLVGDPLPSYARLPHVL